MILMFLGKQGFADVSFLFGCVSIFFGDGDKQFLGGLSLAAPLIYYVTIFFFSDFDLLQS